MSKRLALISLPLAVVLAGCDGERAPVTSSADGTTAADGSPRNASAMSATGAVFTMSNDAAGNAVVVLHRANDGSLSNEGMVATGGLGTGGGLGNQGALRSARIDGNDYIFVCNAGSDDVSVLEMSEQGLVLVDVAPSGGMQPISLAVGKGLVYVLNAGGDGNVAVLTFEDGELALLPSSARPLSGAAVGPAQIELSPYGRLLVVTEKGTNLITTYVVGDDGLPGDPIVNASSGITPFGFSFDRGGRHIVVSEAFGGNDEESAASSYRVNADGSLDVVTASLPSNQSAACWIGTARNGRFAYATNTRSGTVTGYAVAISGELSMLDADGVTAMTGDGSRPIDLVSTGPGGQFIYVLAGGIDEVQGFRVEGDGGLTAIDTASGLPPAVNGLAGW